MGLQTGKKGKQPVEIRTQFYRTTQDVAKGIL